MKWKQQALVLENTNLPLFLNPRLVIETFFLPLFLSGLAQMKKSCRLIFFRKSSSLSSAELSFLLPPPLIWSQCWTRHCFWVSIQMWLSMITLRPPFKADKAKEDIEVELPENDQDTPDLRHNRHTPHVTCPDQRLVLWTKGIENYTILYQSSPQSCKENPFKLDGCDWKKWMNIETIFVFLTLTTS